MKHASRRKREATVQSAPFGTFWKALSGQHEKKRASAFCGVLQAVAVANDMVGAGSHTSMKSAMMAMITLAVTKSSSLLNLPLRFSASAAHFVPIPMPHSMPSLTKKLGSAMRRSRKPSQTPGEIGYLNMRCRLHEGIAMKDAAMTDAAMTDAAMTDECNNCDARLPNHNIQ